MKLPKGKTVYSGGKKYKAGDEIPDDLVKDLDKPAKPARAPKPKPAGDSTPTVKP